MCVCAEGRRSSPGERRGVVAGRGRAYVHCLGAGCLNSLVALQGSIVCLVGTTAGDALIGLLVWTVGRLKIEKAEWANLTRQRQLGPGLTGNTTAHVFSTAEFFFTLNYGTIACESRASYPELICGLATSNLVAAAHSPSPHQYHLLPGLYANRPWLCLPISLSYYILVTNNCVDSLSLLAPITQSSSACKPPTPTPKTLADFCVSRCRLMLVLPHRPAITMSHPPPASTAHHTHQAGVLWPFMILRDPSPLGALLGPFG